MDREANTSVYHRTGMGSDDRCWPAHSFLESCIDICIKMGADVEPMVISL